MFEAIVLQSSTVFQMTTKKHHRNRHGVRLKEATAVVA
jgi:hypothetical protein